MGWPQRPGDWCLRSKEEVYAVPYHLLLYANWYPSDNIGGMMLGLRPKFQTCYLALDTITFPET